MALDVEHVCVRDLFAGEQRGDAFARVAQRLEQRHQLGQPGDAGRHRPPLIAVVRRRRRRRESGCAGRQRVGDHLLHGVDLVLGGVALVAVGAHDEQAHRGVADVARVVQERAARFDRVEVLREGLEVVPRNAGEQRVGRHVLDVLQRPHEQLAVFGPHRRDREPAVAGDDARDAVPAGGAERRVPEHLRVVVGVDVDEPGAHDVARGIELPPAVEPGTDLAHDAVGDGDVGAPARRAGAVDEGAAADDDVCAHEQPPGPKRALSLARGYPPGPGRDGRRSAKVDARVRFGRPSPHA